MARLRRSGPAVLVAALLAACGEAPPAPAPKGAPTAPVPSLDRPAATAEPPGNAFVWGRLTSAADGRALAGATVTVRDWYMVVRGRGVDASASAPALVVESGADGVYVVPVTGFEGPVVSVAARGHASVTWREDKSRPAGAAPRRDASLPPAATFLGTVLAPDGMAVAGARVFAVEWDALEIEEHGDPLAAAADLLWGDGRYASDIAYHFVTATCDAKGIFRIADADPARRYALLAASRDLGPSMLEGPRAPSGPVGEIRLDRAVPLRVRVVDEAGTPLAVRRVELRASPRRVEWTEAGEGTYVLRPVAPGTHALLLDTRERGQVPWVFTLERGRKEPRIDVVLAEGCVVTGVVYDSGGLPVARARVNVQTWDPEAREMRSSNVHTDEEGRFAAKGQPAGFVNLYVVAKGYRTAQFIRMKQPVTGLEVTLLRARSLHLPVALPEGVVCGTLRFSARPLDGGEWSHGAGVVWSDDGVASFDVPVGRVALRLWAPGCALLERELTIEAGDRPLVIEDAMRLLPARTATVRLVDEEGMPVPGLKVHAVVRDLPPVDWTEIAKTSDADGKAVLELHGDPPFTVYIEEGLGRQRVYREIAVPDDPATVIDVRVGARRR